MLKSVTQLEGFVIQATDGELGTVSELYFDDETWAIRYFTVELSWLGGRRVLISPMSVTRTDWRGKRLDVVATASLCVQPLCVAADFPGDGLSRQ